MKLEDIGFYTLSDQRAENTAINSQMMRCEMIINEYCNFKCPYCKGLASQAFAHRRRKELSIEEIKRNIDLWCDNKPLKNIRFSGGEPTYHKGLIEAVDYARGKGIERVAISTNGSNDASVYDELLKTGCNDFSISLDAADSETGEKMAGGIKGAWAKVVNNIQRLSELTYVTVGVVLEPENIKGFVDIVELASGLGVADIRVIPSAQWNGQLLGLAQIDEDILKKHPILKYRVLNFIDGKKIRGLAGDDPRTCPLVLDDSVIAGNYHYPCVIYMREQGEPIGEVCSSMRQERVKWFEQTDTHCDSICRENCLDVCVDYNKKAQCALMTRCAP